SVVRSMLRTLSRGVSMGKQMWLEFIEREGLEALWASFPEQARSEVTELYARLMAQMLAERVSSAKEVCDESKPR
ncbi:MAG: hypothetical protein LC647_04550, partial [Beggiatoa sp.]|nr:hypothetical protein [Beggiatoa sp.]